MDDEDYIYSAVTPKSTSELEKRRYSIQGEITEETLHTPPKT